MTNWKFRIEDDLASRLHNTAVRAGNKAMGKAKIQLRGSLPVDTSSLKNSSRNKFGVPIPEKQVGALTDIELLLGGVDFSGRMMPETGKLGKLVDYAIYIEFRGLQFEGAMSNVTAAIARYLPDELK